jgi:FKBP-type peptidyl-prolyl cis-trans isomerase FkpA
VERSQRTILQQREPNRRRKELHMHRALVLVALAGVLVLPAEAQDTGASAAPTATVTAAPGDVDEQTLYALGVSMAKGLGGLDLSEAEAASVLKGMTDGLAGKATDVDLDAAKAKVNALAKARAAGLLQKEKARSKAFCEEAAKSKGAVVWPSGLIYTQVKVGSGDSPGASDTVKVRYRGTLVDGSEFDSSARWHDPATFGVNNVIRCWTEGLQKMKVGGKARLVCPSEIAYGDRGAPPTIPGGATLVFDLELVSVVKATPVNTQPPNPGAKP